MTWQCSTTSHVPFKPSTAVACPVVATDWIRIRTFRGPMSIWSIISSFASTLKSIKRLLRCQIMSQSSLHLTRRTWFASTGQARLLLANMTLWVLASQCVQVITSRWKVRGMMHNCSIRVDAGWCTGAGSIDANKTAGIELVYAGPHCHAPTCLSVELYNADTGSLLCHSGPICGQSDELYDKHGFLSIPHCLWRDPMAGLITPELLSLDTTATA